MHPKYIIQKLTPEQKQCVRDLLDKFEPDDVLRLLRLEPPSGIGVQMSRATFFRLKRQLEIEEDLSARDSIRSAASALANEEKNGHLNTASLILLKEKAFQLATSSDRADLQAAARILQVIERIEKQNALVEKPIHDEQIRLAIARMALLHFGEIGSIRGNKGLSEEQKQRMVMNRLFRN